MGCRSSLVRRTLTTLRSGPREFTITAVVILSDLSTCLIGVLFYFAGMAFWSPSDRRHMPCRCLQRSSFLLFLCRFWLVDSASSHAQTQQFFGGLLTYMFAVTI